MTVSTLTLPPATLGVPYEAGIAASTTFSAFAVSGLPTGLAVSSVTDPRIVGTPTQTGTFTLAVTGSGSSAALTLTVFGTLGDDESTATGLTPSAMNAQRKLN